MDISRKEFIKLNALAAAGLPFIKLSRLNASADEIESLYGGFISPPNAAKPFVRWWWNGNKVTKDEIVRELDLMGEAGIGGVEINSIKFPSNADAMGIPSHEWLSPEWIDMVETTVSAAEKRGITCDIIVGSGWPFGGRFLDKNEQTQLMTFGTKKLQGPQTKQFSRSDLLDSIELELHSKNEDLIKELVFLRLAPARMEKFTMGEDLSANLNGDNITVEVPNGEYVLYYMVKFTGFQAVINGAPGADGPVLNHYNKDAVEKYLGRMSDNMESQMGELGESFRAMFCDSLELEGANWTGDMLEEFERRRGYSLYPYLPFVLFKTGHMGNPVDDSGGSELIQTVQETIDSVRYDFYKTRLELFNERFIQTFNDWCHEHNVESRVQAYGRGFHPIESSMEIDIPECETWLRSTIGGDHFEEIGLQGRAYTMVNKFVSSGARLSGNKLISCEEITNTGYVFNASLEDIKIAGDQSNLSGVTHSILHGFNYNPEEAEFPGWIRYGTYFNERNTWWPYFNKWADYKARLSYLFQNAELVSDIAVMHPLADMWRKYGPQRDPFPRLNYPDYQHNVWETIHQNGNGCDYVSEKIIQEASFNEGMLRFGDRSYKAIILIEVDSIEPDSARALAKYAESGGKIIFIDRAPYQAPGLQNKTRNDRQVNQSVQRLLNQFSENTGIYPAPGDEKLIDWYRRIQSGYDLSPDIMFDESSAYVSQLHYRSGEKDIYFLANYSNHIVYSSKVTFKRRDNRVPWLWDPETGERYRYPFENSPNELQLRLGPAETKLIVFDEPAEVEEWRIPEIDPSETELLSGPWELTLDHVDGTSRSVKMESLKGFDTDTDLQSFAGTATYKKKFEVLDPEQFTYLDLGTVKGISEVSINGNTRGTQWYGQHIYETGNSLEPGENEITIKVTTVLGNYVKSLTDNEVAQRWTRGQELNKTGLIGPVKLIK